MRDLLCYHNQHNVIKRYCWRCVLLKFLKAFLFVSVLLAGCVSYEPSYNNNYMIEHKKLVSYKDKLPIFTIRENPDLQAGDSFVFDDGSKETVVAKYGDKTEWLSSNGANYMVSNNPILHYSAWTYDNKSNDKPIIDVNYNVPDNFMWPLSLFAEGRFVASEDYAKSRILFSDAYNVKCKIEDISKIKTDKMDFDTFVISCSTGVFGEKTVRYYSPELGFFVKIITKRGLFSSKTKTFKSCTIDPEFLSEDDNNLIERARDSALTFGPREGGYSKYLNNIKLKVSIFIQASNDIDGKKCYNYTKSLERGDCRYIETDAACQIDDKHWKSSKIED